MCKILLATLVVLSSANAYAGPCRGLSLGSTENLVASLEQNKPRTTEAAPQKSASAAKSASQHPSRETRLTSELRRLGIYW